jgi:UDP-glucuronate 4-epimerase
MRVLVTGAAGFIGSHLSATLLESGHEVVGVDSFDDFYDPGRKRSNAARLQGDPSFVLHRADIRDKASLEPAIEGVDAVVHLAARAGVRPSFQVPALYAEVNVTGTMVLLELIRERSIPRFVFASSSSVYGEGARTPFEEDAPLGIPASPYASTKLAGEMLCRNFAPEIPHLAMLRLFTVYGPRQRPDLAIHKFARLMLAGETIPMYGSSESFRDYTFVSDIVAGITASLEVDDPWLVCNLGSGRPIQLGEMISHLETALGIEAHIEHLPPQEGDLFGTWASIEKAKEALRYEPRVTFAEGVASFVAWIREAGATD